MQPETRFTELDFLAWIAAAVFLTLPLATLLLISTPQQVTQTPLAVPPIGQSVTYQVPATAVILDSRV